MKVSKKDIDKLNSIISIDIEKNDFESNVENVLKDYRKIERPSDHAPILLTMRF